MTSTVWTTSDSDTNVRVIRGERYARQCDERSLWSRLAGAALDQVAEDTAVLGGPGATVGRLLMDAGTKRRRRSSTQRNGRRGSALPGYRPRFRSVQTNVSDCISVNIGETPALTACSVSSIDHWGRLWRNRPDIHNGVDECRDSVGLPRETVVCREHFDVDWRIHWNASAGSIVAHTRC